MKKNLISGNPVLDILGYEALSDDALSETVSSPEKKPVRKLPSNSAPKTKSPSSEIKNEELNNFLSDISKEKEEKRETKSKRLNLLVKPSTLNEISKIAQKYGISVNEFINRILEACIKKND